MPSLLDTLLGFPTGIFSIMLLMVVAYWLLVLLGAMDVDIFDFDADLEDGVQSGGFLSSLGLSGVPVTVVVSLLVLCAWLFSALGTLVLDALVPAGMLRVLAALVLLLLSLGLAVLFSALAVRPLQRFFDVGEARHKASLVGQVCTLTTLRVDEEFGQAAYDDGGAGLLVQVRAAPGNGLTKGARLLIIGQDQQQDAYRVRAYDARPVS